MFLGMRHTPTLPLVCLAGALLAALSSHTQVARIGRSGAASSRR